MTRLAVDVIIATHRPDRPVSRAIRSVLDGSKLPIRVTVVCHNMDPQSIDERLSPWKNDSRLRVTAWNDGIKSPAGPFNHGLTLADADFVSIMGSDDELEPGALDAWHQIAVSTGSVAVLAPLEHGHGRRVPTPPTRLLRSRGLDMVKDRLAYRTAPLGLISRDRFGALRFTDGVRTGEDIAYSLAMWSSTRKLAYARRAPAYIIHADRPDRVTTLLPPIESELEFLSPLFAGSTYRDLDSAQRASLLVKLTRVTMFGLVHNRQSYSQWSVGDRQTLVSATERIMAELADTRALHSFSRAEHRLLTAMSDAAVPVADLVEIARRSRSFLTARALLTNRLRDLWRRDAPLRFYAASFLASRY